MNEQNHDIDERPAKGNLLTNPLSAYSIPPWLVYILSVVGVIYLLNPTAGFIELLPDNIPFLGNLDEGLATVLIWSGIMELVEGKKRRAASRKTDE